MIAQGTMSGHGVGAGHRQQLAPALVQYDTDMEERLEPRSEATPRAPYTLGDRS